MVRSVCSERNRGLRGASGSVSPARREADLLERATGNVKSCHGPPGPLQGSRRQHLTFFAPRLAGVLEPRIDLTHAEQRVGIRVPRGDQHDLRGKNSKVDQGSYGEDLPVVSGQLLIRRKTLLVACRLCRGDLRRWIELSEKSNRSESPSARSAPVIPPSEASSSSPGKKGNDLGMVFVSRNLGRI